jgi:hypothetical protein
LACSMPHSRARCFGDSSSDAPQLPSTCSHMPCWHAMGATAAIGSKPPVTVVPAVSPTKNGTCKHSTEELQRHLEQHATSIECGCVRKLCRLWP